MDEKPPTKMISLTTPRYADPSAYQHSTLPKPTVQGPHDIVIEVKAASVNPIDTKLANGLMKMAVKETFPFKLGYDCSGVVTAVGDEVTTVKVGDEVFTRLPEMDRGSWSEVAKTTDKYVTKKPSNVSFEEAASLPLAAMTALQALRMYRGYLKGKTVFVPAGLSGTGAYACQLAKNVFGVEKVITTVSTAKVKMVHELLGADVVDQIIDYQKEDIFKKIPPKSVDFILDTTGQAMSFMPLMTDFCSVIVSISTKPSGTLLQQSSLMDRPDNPKLPFMARLFLDLMHILRWLWACYYGVDYQYLLLDPNAEDLSDIAHFVEEKLLRPVVGATADFYKIEEVRKVCDAAHTGKGGVGKAVITLSRKEKEQDEFVRLN